MMVEQGRRQVVKLTRAMALVIMREGQAAKADGKAATECPYYPGGDATERVRVQAWLRGYLGGGKRKP